MNEKPLLTPAGELRRRSRCRLPWRWILPGACLLFALGCAAYAHTTAHTQPVGVETSSAYSFVQLVPEGAWTPVSVRISQAGESYELRQGGNKTVLDDGAVQVNAQKAAAH